MAIFEVHLGQGKHNEEVASHLLNVNGTHDWAITVCFYSAIHFVEARLCYTHFQHTETSVPLKNGELEYTPHRWREKIVRENFLADVWRSFRKLRENSEQARYLSLSRGGVGGATFLTSPATDFFSREDARRIYDRELQTIKKGLKLELNEFLHSLEMQNVNMLQANLTIRKLLDKYNSKNELLAQSRQVLSRQLNIQELQLFLRCLNDKGYQIAVN